MIEDNEYVVYIHFPFSTVSFDGVEEKIISVDRFLSPNVLDGCDFFNTG